MTAAKKMGRPTKYREEMGERLIALMAEGLSKAAVADALGVNQDTIYEWCKARPEFAEAPAIGKTLRALKLEGEAALPTLHELFMDTGEFATIAGVDPEAIRRRARRGYGPRPVKVSNRLLWRREAVAAWLEELTEAA